MGFYNTRPHGYQLLQTVQGFKLPCTGGSTNPGKNSSLVLAANASESHVDMETEYSDGSGHAMTTSYS